MTRNGTFLDRIVEFNKWCNHSLDIEGTKMLNRKMEINPGLASGIEAAGEIVCGQAF